MKSFNMIILFALVVIALSSCDKKSDDYNWDQNPPVTNGPVTNNPPSNGPSTNGPSGGGPTIITPTVVDSVFNPKAYNPSGTLMDITDAVASGGPGYDLTDIAGQQAAIDARSTSGSARDYWVTPDFGLNSLVDGGSIGVTHAVWLWAYSPTYGYIKCATGTSTARTLAAGRPVTLKVSLNANKPYAVMVDPNQAAVGEQMSDFSQSEGIYGYVTL